MLRTLHRYLHGPTKDKKNLFLAAAAFCFFLAAMLSMVELRMADEALAARVAPSVLRFHVLANSDSDADQELKLQVKQMLIDYMYEDLKQEYIFSGHAADETLSKETLIDYVTLNHSRLEQQAENYMQAKGFPYTASIRVEACYFPSKIYGDVVFPCGTYDAVRVLLGEGAGKNWWCVLYPPLCFTDNAAAVVPDSSKAELRSLLAEDDFRSLMKKRRIVFGERQPDPRDSAAVTVRVRSRLFDLVTGSQ